MKLVFNEWYGEISYAVNAAIKKYNVSPSDYRDIIDHLGAPTWDEVKAYIVKHSPTGYYQPPLPW